MDFVRLWLACRGAEGGVINWPASGGVADQAAWVVDAFGVLAGADAEFRKAEGG